MSKKLALAAAVTAITALAPLPSASAICDPEFFARTGSCSACHIRQEHERSPQHDVICIQ